MPDWEDVTEVKTEAYLRLFVRFRDGLSGKVCFESSFLTGVFERFKDPSYFAQAYVHDGYVTWPGELDLAPDAMYEEIKKNGEWVLR